MVSRTPSALFTLMHQTALKNEAPPPTQQNGPTSSCPLQGSHRVCCQVCCQKADTAGLRLQPGIPIGNEGPWQWRMQGVCVYSSSSPESFLKAPAKYITSYPRTPQAPVSSLKAGSESGTTLQCHRATEPHRHPAPSALRIFIPRRLSGSVG